MTAYYNEHEPYAAQWLRNLIAAGHIAPGDVDARDIQDVTPDDLAGYTQCHFFAGIGGWSYALRLAGWPDDRPVWTGSCPCQPLSSAGQQQGAADERHLWPAFFELIAECRPPAVIGEQVSSRLGREWFAGVRLDLESVAYAVGGADLPAACVGAPHIRQRLWWVAERLGVSDRPGRRAGIVAIEAARHGDSAESTSRTGGLADAERAERGPVDHARQDERLDGVSPRQEGAGRTRSGGEDGGLADPRRVSDERRMRSRETSGSARTAESEGDQRQRSGADPWRSSERIPCADGRARRIPQSGIFPLADGIPGRVGQLRAYGNAIVPEVAAVFIRAYREGPRARS